MRYLAARCITSPRCRPSWTSHFGFNKIIEPLMKHDNDILQLRLASVSPNNGAWPVIYIFALLPFTYLAITCYHSYKFPRNFCNQRLLLPLNRRREKTMAKNLKEEWHQTISVFFVIGVIYDISYTCRHISNKDSLYLVFILSNVILLIASSPKEQKHPIT